MARAGQLGKTLAIDSTCYDTHFTRHYERRKAQHARGDEKLIKQRTSRPLHALPKLAVGIDTRTHLATCALSRTGQRSDAPDFAPLLREAHNRCPPQTVLADAGYDSAANHALARDRLGVRSWIKAKIGRRSSKPATDRHRRHMQRQLQGSQAGQPYGQRAQVETVMSMLKRNLGGHLRCRTSMGRELEMLFKVVVHNLMIVQN